MPGMHIEGVPEEAANRLRDLLDPNDELTTDAVIDDARDPSSPLHRYFEWDDSEAAEKYRQVQAGLLIRRVRVVWQPSKKSEPRRVRAFVSTHDLDTGLNPTQEKGAYRAVESIAASEELLLKHIQREIDRLTRKYKDVKEFADLLRGAAEQIEQADSGEDEGEGGSAAIAV